MSSESSKNPKPKVIRSEGAPAEGKRNRTDPEQVGKHCSEEAEVDLRDPGRDYDLYKYTCQELQRLMAEIQDLKSRGGKDVAVEIEEWRIQSCVHFMTLKKLHRLDHIRLKKGRDQTHEAKQKVDDYHLQLQNLLYEVMHLQKEITKTWRNRSADPGTSGLGAGAAEKTSREVPRGPVHKEKILKEIEVKKEYLSSLQPRLNSMQASLPAQEYLFMLFDQAHKQYETARQLPPPLYVLFVQATAYGQACGKTLTVAIKGSVDEALFKPPDDSQDDKSDSDAKEEQTTKWRRPTPGVQLDDKHREILRRHPLSVMVDLKCKDDSMPHLTFYYLMNLNILTVKAKVTPATELITPISASCVLMTRC
ncbi:THO complex subunit 5 like protein [Fukomys damarensis]|uniref:THO complex subunit 5 like protein n=1 Tax=Fukomys damarensis TaxID=885580 RepID=A0A091CQ13_FUKDA|nr:THO complex subunit 5 like protein [Fukomys damarensis]